MNTNNQNQTRAAIKSLVFEALTKSAAERDERCGWIASTELSTGYKAVDGGFAGRAAVIKVKTLKLGGRLLTRASVEYKEVGANGYVSYGFSTNGFPSLRIETAGRATERAINAQHIQTLCSPAFEQWAVAAMSYAAAGSPL